MSAPAPRCYFVVLLEPEPLVVPDGEVVDELPVVPVADPEPVAEPDGVLELGLVVVPGDADGVRSGVLPTRSVSAWLQAAVMPTTNARAQKPDSIFFIVALLPCGCSSSWKGCNRHARGS